MSNIIIRPGWAIPESEVTPEPLYKDRRRFLRTLGLGAIGAAVLGCKAPGGRSSSNGGADPRAAGAAAFDKSPVADLFPAKRNPKYTVDRALTDEAATASYNNYYEFTEDKGAVHELVDKFQTRPWDLEITGMVSKPVKLTVDQLMRKLPLEERVYRHRCVEAWAMTVPWTGIPLRDVLALAAPTGQARFVRFVSYLKPDQAPNQQRATWYKWPYYEALRIDEAMNELTLVGLGIYGHELPKQNGAPIRIVTPWKYGYKSPKGVVRIELTDKQPGTFWNDLVPDEYSFLSNVDPTQPHPRWSQATEQLIDTKARVSTLPYNGYGPYVASMY